MKANEIKVGDHYIAKVGVNLTVVEVTKITKRDGYRPGGYGQRACPGRTTYSVTNLKTGRTTSFESAAKFRRAATIEEIRKAKGIAVPTNPAWKVEQPRAADTMKAAGEHVLAAGHYAKLDTVVADLMKLRTLEAALGELAARCRRGAFNANDHDLMHKRIIDGWDRKRKDAAPDDRAAIAAVELESQDEINRTNLVNGKVVVTPPADDAVLRDILKADPTRPTPRHTNGIEATVIDTPRLVPLNELTDRSSIITSIPLQEMARVARWCEKNGDDLSSIAPLPGHRHYFVVRVTTRGRYELWDRLVKVDMFDGVTQVESRLLSMSEADPHPPAAAGDFRHSP